MKKLTLVILLSVFTATFALAQGTLGKGGKQLNAGLGFSGWGVPVFVGLDFGVDESITIGPRISYRNYAYNRASYKFNQSLTVLSFNGNYHFNKLLNLPSEWNFYAGITLGYYLWSDVRTSSGIIDVGNSSRMGLEGQIGGRYFFSDNFGVNLEFGGGTGTGGGSIGITYKF